MAEEAEKPVTEARARSGLGTLVMYGGAVCLLGAGVVIVLQQRAATPPTDPDAGLYTPLPIPNFGAVKGEACEAQGAYAALCARMKRFYPKFDPRIIAPLKALVDHHNERHEQKVKLSDMLALCLIESFCNPLDKSNESTAMGPFHYLTDGMVDLVNSTRILNEARRILPKDRRDTAIDGIKARTEAYGKERAQHKLALLKAKRELRRMPPKKMSLADKKARTAALRQTIKQQEQALKAIRITYRDDVMRDFPDAVFALQGLDVLKKSLRRPFEGGCFYIGHFLGPGGAPQLHELRAWEDAIRHFGDNPIGEMVFAQQIGDLKLSSVRGLGNGNTVRVTIEGQRKSVKIEGFLVPKVNEGVIPALAGMGDQAGSNHSLFFIPVEHTIKGEEGKPDRKVWVLSPLSADQIFKSIVARWNDRLTRTLPFDNPPQLPGSGDAKAKKHGGLEIIIPGLDGRPAQRFALIGGNLVL